MARRTDRFGVFPELHITVDPLPANGVRVTIAGEITLDNVEQLRRVLRDTIDQRHATGVEVDMALVTFIDSTGVGKLIAARAHARTNGADVWIARPSPGVRRVLSLLGLLDILTTRGWAPPKSA